MWASSTTAEEVPPRSLLISAFEFSETFHSRLKERGKNFARCEICGAPTQGRARPPHPPPATTQLKTTSSIIPVRTRHARRLASRAGRARQAQAVGTYATYIQTDRQRDRDKQTSDCHTHSLSPSVSHARAAPCCLHHVASLPQPQQDMYLRLCPFRWSV